MKNLVEDNSTWKVDALSEFNRPISHAIDEILVDSLISHDPFTSK